MDIAQSLFVLRMLTFTCRLPDNGSLDMNILQTSGLQTFGVRRTIPIT